MTTEQLANVATSMRAISGALAEFERQRAQGAKPDSYSLISTLTRESTRLEVNEQTTLAEGFRSLRDEIDGDGNA